MKSRFKTKIKLALWTILAISGGMSLAFSVFYLASLDFGSKNANTAAILNVNTTKKEEKPKYFYLNKGETKDLKISAGAYLVGDLNTGEIILSKNIEKKFPIASISKLMTALVERKLGTGEEIAKVSKRALDTPGKNGGLRVGEKIKTADLVYPLLLESSNDAAEIIAESFGRDLFIKKMNQEAANLKMPDTSYQDPSGLSPKNQSTASDTFKLVGYLNKQKPDLISITKSVSFSNKKHSWSNISQFIRKDGYMGGKSGYTDEAKQTVVSLFSLPLAEAGNRPIAIVLLQSPDRGRDVENILKYVKKNVYYGGAADANTNWVEERVGAPELRDPDFVTLTLGGDIMLDRGVKNSVIKNFNGDYSKLFSKPDLSNLLKKSDIVFANLEGTVSDKGKDGGGLYSFRMDPAVIPALAGSGIKVLSVTNNHVGDWGLGAYLDTLSRLKENEILYVGGGNNSVEAERPAIVEKYGMKIGFLGFSDKGPDWMKATEDKAGILLASNPRLPEIIKNASQQVDALVVSFHFGEEYQANHDERQEILAHKSIDSGAKIVIGHHPHVVQDFEVYSPKDCAQSSCVGFIAYSLGNFIFDQSWSQRTMEGLLLEVKIWRDGSMSVRKNSTKLNSAFQPDRILKGKEEKVEFKK